MPISLPPTEKALGRKVVVFERLQAQQGRASLDLDAGDDLALLESGTERCAQHRLHLHALQHQEGLVGLHGVALLDFDLPDGARDFGLQGGVHGVSLMALLKPR